MCLQSDQVSSPLPNTHLTPSQLTSVSNNTESWTPASPATPPNHSATSAASQNTTKSPNTSVPSSCARDPRPRKPSSCSSLRLSLISSPSKMLYHRSRPQTLPKGRPAAPSPSTPSVSPSNHPSPPSKPTHGPKACGQSSTTPPHRAP